jgi:hypothetical protein
MNQLGFVATDSNGELKSLTQIVKELEESGITTAQAMEIFGLRAGPAMLGLISQGSEALRVMTGELNMAGGTADRIASIQMEGLKGAFIELKSALEGAAISAGEVMAPVLERLASGIRSLAQRFAELPEGTRKAIVVMGLLAATLGPLLVILGAMVAALPAVAAGFSLLFSPVGILVGLFAAALAGIVSFMGGMEVLMQGMDGLRQVLDTLNPVIEFFKWSWEAVSVTFQAMLLPALMDLWKSLQPFVPYLKILAKFFGAVVVGAVLVLVGALTALTVILTTIVTIATRVQTAIVKSILDPLQTMKNVVTALINPLQTVINLVKKLGGLVGLDKVTDFFKNSFQLGGTVPGPVGKPVPIIAHGQEQIIPAGQSGFGGFGAGVNVTINNPTVRSDDDLDQIKRQINDVFRPLIEDHKLDTI